MRKPLILLIFLTNLQVFGQLPDGSVAPDFTLTDYYGTTHNLYTYLNSGKTVIMEVFAAHCPTCWAYHQTHTLKHLYEAYGPEGTNELMVLALEHDQWNGPNEFMGIGPPWTTAGDWLTGTPYPIFDVEDPDRGVFTDYNIQGYPIIFTICPDRILERVFTNQTVEQLYAKVQDCQASVSINEVQDLGNIRIDPVSRSLIIDRFEQVRSLDVVDLQGRSVLRTGAIARPTIPLGALPGGVYLFRIGTDGGPVVERLYLD